MRLALSILILILFSLFLIYPLSAKQSPDFKNLTKIAKDENLPDLHDFPVKKENAKPPPEITARSAVILDAKSGVSLYEKSPSLRHLPASTTKLMTAIVALEKCSQQDIVQVTKVNKDGTQMGLDVGDLISVENLLKGLLISSGNDAAFALANGCSDSLNAFINEMNQKAKELNMLNTNFENPAGFDSLNQYSTAKDLATLAKVAVANPLISKIVALKSTIAQDATGNKEYYLENVNKLLGEVEGLEGIKTGQTEGALEILVSKTTRDTNTIIISILGSEDRFGETKDLIEWVFENHNWIEP